MQSTLPLRRLALIGAAVGTLSACAHSTPTPAQSAAAERSGKLDFTVADDSIPISGPRRRFVIVPNHGRMALLIDAGGQGCDVRRPYGTYALAGRRVRLEVRGVRTLIDCRAPAGPTRRYFSGEVSQLATGDYDVTVVLLDDPPGTNPTIVAVTIP